jgi:hypothetical protein
MLKYFSEYDNSEYYAIFATDALKMILMLWLTDKKQLMPHELVLIAKDAVFNTAERCAEIFRRS